MTSARLTVERQASSQKPRTLPCLFSRALFSTLGQKRFDYLPRFLGTVDAVHPLLKIQGAFENLVGAASALQALQPMLSKEKEAFIISVFLHPK